MHDEFQKIAAYFAEARQTWTRNPETVLTRQFFELWEQTTQPQPFLLATTEFEFLGRPLAVPEKHTVGHFAWDFAEECAALVLESPGYRLRYLLTFAEGVPQLGEPLLTELEDTTVSLGERLEFILDVIAEVRRHYPSRHVLETLKAEYNAVLPHLQDRYDSRLLRVMAGQKLPAIRSLIRRAVQDMAQDELSDQLVLPLDGSYAVGGEPASSVVAGTRPFAMRPAPPRTRWAIAGDLRFVTRAGEALARLEQETVLGFDGHEVLQAGDPLILRLPVKCELPWRAGDRMLVYERGTDPPVAAFVIEINDRDSLVGRLEWPDRPEPLTARHFCRPPRSPAKLLAQLCDALAGEFVRLGRFASAALNAALGVEAVTFEDTPPPATAPALDASQQRAWANAVNPHNILTLIQGPPGTGKTHVLVEVLRDLCARGKRVLVVAPSHAAVDNVCRRVLDLPVLRLGRERDRLAPDVAAACWIGELACVQRFQAKRQGQAAIYAGTPVGLLTDSIVQTELEKNGLFDTIILDEAGMTRLDEFLLDAKLARQAVLVGDHQQLPPFPLPEAVLTAVTAQQPATHSQQRLLRQSALQWLLEQRQVPVFLLQSSYRCQNPRLMRFSSTLFYNAQVKASVEADYYQLPFAERRLRYPPSTLRFYSTSGLPLAQRQERLVLAGGQPGYENPLEAALAARLVYAALPRFPLHEITVIAPYRCQVRRLRAALDPQLAARALGKKRLRAADWETFLETRISTVDSFQGGESDLVIICYVRSSAAGGIGFVDDPNRINVAHTRCRREMAVIGDLDCLQRAARSRIFHRMARAIQRDGEIVPVTPALLAELGVSTD